MSTDSVPIGPLGRPFWTLWAASAASNLADGVFKVVVPLIAVTLTRDPVMVAGVAVAASLPWLLFALPAGALVDRMDRRRVMLGANLVRGGVLAILTLGVSIGSSSIWPLYAAAVAIGCAEVMYDTSAQSILPQVVRRAQLPRANSRLYAAELTSNEFVGPPLGGLLVGLGFVVALLFPSAAWLVAVAALWQVRGNFRVARTTRTTMRADIAEGLRFLWSQPVLRTLAVMTGVSNFAGNAVFAILVLYAVGPQSAMGLTATGYGLLLTASALGALLGSLVAERVVRRIGRSAALGVTLVGGTLMSLGPALTTNPFIIGAGYLVGGFTIAIWNITVVSLRQGITPAGLLGRLNSAYRLLAWGMIPLGALAGGVLARWLGLRPVFWIMAAVVAGLLGLMPLVSNARLDAADRSAADTGDPDAPPDSDA